MSEFEKIEGIDDNIDSLESILREQGKIISKQQIEISNLKKQKNEYIFYSIFVFFIMLDFFALFIGGGFVSALIVFQLIFLYPFGLSLDIKGIEIINHALKNWFSKK